MGKDILILGFVFTAVLVSGCVDSPENSMEENSSIDEALNDSVQESNPEVSSEDIDRVVEIRGGPGIQYDKNQVEVDANETVRFVYIHEGGTHDLVLERNGEDVASTQVKTEKGSEGSFVYTFNDDGDYQFYCSVGTHRQQGMEGNVLIS